MARKIEDMARGWESKSVEEQMASSQQKAGAPDANGFVSEDARRLAEQHRTERERQKQALKLQRENILSQRTAHPARRAALEAALIYIEDQIEALR
jgi:hypothetical protein